MRSLEENADIIRRGITIMTKAELIQKIEDGSDIMFDVAGKHFTILTWMEEGIGIGEQYPNDTEMQYFKTAKELVEGFKINGVALEDLVQGVRITDYS